MRIPIGLALTGLLAAAAIATVTADRRGAPDPAAPGSSLVAGPATAPASTAAPRPASLAAVLPQDQFEYYPYDGRMMFVRIMPRDARGSRRGFGGFRGGREPPWLHDYPSAEHNLSKIVRELTFARIRVENWGSNILTLDDPRLMQFPVAYMSEPGYWSVTPDEADAMRDYLLKGGFIIFDDFGGNQGRYDMYNLAEQMALVLPELTWVRLDLNADIFDSFFQIDPDNLQLAASGSSYRGIPVFYGLFEDNDQDDGRLLAIAADAGDFGEFWEFSERGYYPVDISNEAYKVGINYMVYALTH